MIRDALNAYATRTERLWKHDRSKTIGASEIGMCARRIWFSKVKTASDEGHIDNWGYRVRGKIYEEAWFVPALRARYGKRLRYAGDSQKTFIDPPLSATPDGLLRELTLNEQEHLGLSIETDCVLIEAKNVGSYKLALAPKPEHEFQVQVQMGLVRAAGRYWPTAAVLVYTSAFDWSEIAEFVIQFDMGVFSHARKRASEILSAPNAEAVKAEGMIAGSKECRRCPFKGPCGDIEMARDQRANALAA